MRRLRYVGSSYNGRKEKGSMGKIYANLSNHFSVVAAEMCFCSKGREKVVLIAGETMAALKTLGKSETPLPAENWSMSAANNMEVFFLLLVL